MIVTPSSVLKKRYPYSRWEWDGKIGYYKKLGGLFYSKEVRSEDGFVFSIVCGDDIERLEDEDNVILRIVTNNFEKLKMILEKLEKTYNDYHKHKMRWNTRFRLYSMSYNELFHHFKIKERTDDPAYGIIWNKLDGILLNKKDQEKLFNRKDFPFPLIFASEIYVFMLNVLDEFFPDEKYRLIESKGVYSLSNGMTADMINNHWRR
jgi:hypothetical protein